MALLCEDLALNLRLCRHYLQAKIEAYQKGGLRCFSCDPASERMVLYWSLCTNSLFSCPIIDGGQRSGSATGQHSGTGYKLQSCSRTLWQTRYLLKQKFGASRKWQSRQHVKERSRNRSKSFKLALSEISVWNVCFFCRCTFKTSIEATCFHSSILSCCTFLAVHLI